MYSSSCPLAVSMCTESLREWAHHRPKCSCCPHCNLHWNWNRTSDGCSGSRCPFLRWSGTTMDDDRCHLRCDRQPTARRPCNAWSLRYSPQNFFATNVSICHGCNLAAASHLRNTALKACLYASAAATVKMAMDAPRTPYSATPNRVFDLFGRQRAMQGPSTCVDDAITGIDGGLPVAVACVVWLMVCHHSLA